MHGYTIDSRERVVVVRVLFLASAFLSGIVAMLMPSYLFPRRWLLPIPSIGLLFGVSYWAFDNWLWRWRFLRDLRLISIPDLSGTWTGLIASSYSGFDNSQQVTVRIVQTWTKMAVHLTAQESRSWSLTASVLTNVPEGLTLTYLFDNDPNVETSTALQRFRGTAVLVCTAPNLLTGYYYSGRGRETYGSLKLRR